MDDHVVEIRLTAKQYRLLQAYRDLQGFPSDVFTARSILLLTLWPLAQALGDDLA